MHENERKGRVEARERETDGGRPSRMNEEREGVAQRIGGRGMQRLCPSTSLKPDPGLRIPSRLLVAAAPLRHPRHPRHPTAAQVYRSLLVRLLFRQVRRKRLEDPPIVLAIKAVVLTLSLLVYPGTRCHSLSPSYEGTGYVSISWKNQRKWFARIHICPRVTFPREKRIRGAERAHRAAPSVSGWTLWAPESLIPIFTLAVIWESGYSSGYSIVWNSTTFNDHYNVRLCKVTSRRRFLRLRVTFSV